jgi:hypothetical protein
MPQMDQNLPPGSLAYLKEYLKRYSPKHDYKAGKGPNGEGGTYIIKLYTEAEELQEQARQKAANVGNQEDQSNAAAQSVAPVPMQQAANLLKKEFPKEFLKSMGLI